MHACLYLLQVIPSFGISLPDMGLELINVQTQVVFWKS